MRPIDRILGRSPSPAPSYAVRPFGTSISDAAAADSAAQATGTDTAPNLTTGDVRPSKLSRFGSGISQDDL